MPYLAKPPIFIVDDEPGTLEGMKILFENNNFRVDTFDSGLKVLNTMKTRTYAVGIVDILLIHDKKDGEELLADLKSAWPLTEIIIVTARKGEQELAKRCYNKGAYDFVTKPWDNDALVRTVQRAAEKYEMKRRLEVFEKRALVAGKKPAKLELKLAKLPETIKKIEKDAIFEALSAAQWNQVHAAKSLGIHRNTMVKKMKQYKITTAKGPKGIGLKGAGRGRPKST